MKKRTGIAMQGIGMIGVLIGGAGLDSTTPAAAVAVIIVSLLLLMIGESLHNIEVKKKREKIKRQNTMFRTWLKDTKMHTGGPY